MMKISRLLALAGLTAALLSGTAFAQSTSTGAMSSSDHMSGGAMTSTKGNMASGHMKGHMKTNHMKMSKHSKKSGHMTSGSMTSGH